MKKRLGIMLLIVLLTMSLLTACGGNDSSSGEEAAEETETAAEQEESAPAEDGELRVIRVGHPYDATSLDPQRAYDDGSIGPVINMGEGLVRGYDGEVYPGIAESWENSEDGLTYTFHLRESNWSDGTPLTAQDFVYAVERVLTPGTAYDNVDSFYTLANAEAAHQGEVDFSEVGVKAIDDYTIEYTLGEPDLAFLYRLCTAAWLPLNREKCEAEGDTYGSEADKVLTNGPFTCTEWAHESKIVLTKNENYWNADDVKIGGVTFVIGAEADVAKDMFLAGDLDYAQFVTNMDIDALKDSLQYDVYNSTYYFCHLNCAGHDEAMAPYMSNANFRKALNYAISRKAIVDVASIPAEPAYRVAAPSLETASGKTWDEAYPLEGWSTEADPEKAKEYLDLALSEIGGTVEDIPPLVMLCFDSQGNLDKYQAMQDMLLQTLGIRSEISPQPIQQMLEMAYSGDYDFWLGGKSVEAPDWLSEVAFDYYGKNAGTASFYSNPEYDMLYEKAKGAATSEEREQALYEMEKIIADETVDLCIYWLETYSMYVPELHNVSLTNDMYGVVFANAYFD